MKKQKTKSKLTGSMLKLRKQIMKGIMVKAPDITIERVGWDSVTGEVTFIDVHNEANGKAYFFTNPSAHFHGFYKTKKSVTKKKK